MAQDLGEVVNREMNTASDRPPHKPPKTNSIDDKFEQREDGLYYRNPNPNTLDKKLKLDKRTGFFRKAWDLFKYSPLIAAQFALFGPVITLSTTITTTGFAIGGYFESKKAGKKYTWRRLRRELYSGNLFGFIDYAVFSVPSLFSKMIPYLSSAGILPKIVKWLLFEAMVVPPVVTAYRGIEYIRDQMGWKNFFKRVLTFRGFGALKEVYVKGIKGGVLKDSKGIWKVSPIHFPQLNYLPSVQLMMAQSAFLNNPLFRYLMGKKTTGDIGKKAKNYATNTYKKAKDYTAPGTGYQPNYGYSR